MPGCRWICLAALVTTTMGCSRCPGDEIPPSQDVTADPALPGLGDGSPILTTKLRAALTEKGREYQPRTRHLRPDGAPTFVNRLILETSPYLLQHAHNPVNWYPWGDEPFERAAREGKAVLLSIGYSTCHWCHVMEHESFEDIEIAELINRNLVPIKVDREERPDVDDTYMKAVQMLSGHSGWPMTLLLTPDRQPFFGATYLPPRDGDRGARRGLLSVLGDLIAEYDADPQSIATRARRITERIQASTAAVPADDIPGAVVIDQAARSLALSFDPRWGGFGGGPKFPQPSALELLMRYHRRTGDPQALHIVTHTLEKIAAGAIHDQLGGGFHRYTTDAAWLVPHFEKMLYDNAQLVVSYLDAHRLTGREDFARVARSTLDYVAREMTAPQGAFFSASDADSPSPSGHREEGRFYTWTRTEVEAVLGPQAAEPLLSYYSVEGAPQVDGRHVLHRGETDEEVARKLGVSATALREQVTQARVRLVEARRARPPPPRDETILTAWNGLMISAFARAGLVLHSDDYVRRAATAARFLLEKVRSDDGRLRRNFVGGRARHPAYLDDYAFLTQGLLDLHDVTSDRHWLDRALELREATDRSFWDAEHGGYFLTPLDRPAPLARDKPIDDGALPSANAVAAMNLLRIAELTIDPEPRARAERILAAFATHLERAPTRSTKMLSVLEAYLDAFFEVVIVTATAADDGDPLVNVYRTSFVPNSVLLRTHDAAPAGLALLHQKTTLAGRPTAYVCEQGRCQLPTHDPNTLAGQLGRTRPLLPRDLQAPLPVAPSP